MALFRDFPESNKIFTGFEDDNLPGGSCGDLPVLTTKEGCNISCWQFTKEELHTIVRNKGVVWLMVWGQGHPPVDITADKPFKMEEGIIIPSEEEIKHATRHRR